MGGGVPEGVEGRVRGALDGLAGRDVDLFLVRLRRWWGDLAEGLAGPYGERHDLGELLERVAVLLAERYRERGEELKLLDLERSIRPDWFQDPATIGYVCYADRFAGTLEGVGEHLDYLGRAGRALPAPDAAAGPAGGRLRRWVRGARLPRRRPPARDHGRPGAVVRAGQAPGDQRLRRPGPQPLRGRALMGGGRPGRRPRGRGDVLGLPRPGAARRLRADPPRGLPRLRPRQLQLPARDRQVGLDQLQHLPVGPELVQPPRLHRDGRRAPQPGQPRRRGAAAGRGRVHLEAARHQLPEPARGPRPAARRCGPAPGSSPRRWSSRPRRS